MAYITNFNAKKMYLKMSKSVYVDASDFDLEYKSKIDIFSDNEVQWLIRIKDLFKNFDFYVEKIFSKDKKIDTGTYINEKIPPSYHSSNDCTRLLSKFEDYLIPPEIRGRGEKEIERFRTFFRENVDRYHNDRRRFTIQVELNFRIRNIGNLEVERNNSGYTDIKNIDLAHIEKDIDFLIIKAMTFRDADSKTSNIIKNAANKSGYLNKYDKETTNILKQWNDIKWEIKNHLINYYMVKFSQDLNFSGTLLEELGFRECSTCKKNEISNCRLAA